MLVATPMAEVFFPNDEQETHFFMYRRNKGNIRQCFVADQTPLTLPTQDGNKTEILDKRMPSKVIIDLSCIRILL